MALEVPVRMSSVRPAIVETMTIYLQHIAQDAENTMEALVFILSGSINMSPPRNACHEFCNNDEVND